jgi:RNA polymerase sigma factor (sigma-70 family)
VKSAATTPVSRVIDNLRRTLLRDGGADLTDGQLLDRFVSFREEAALEVLVRRHAAMVWGVCLRLLQNDQDAEDAFQATFLVLVRKAASVWPRDMVANWLYGVAHQTALKARQTMAKRRTREKQVTTMPEPAAEREADDWRDLQPLLDQELSRLPAKYRSAIVLCDLEGKSRKEAAGQLKIPEGTLSSRLTTARTKLAKRLARHGLAVSGGTLAGTLSQNVASAGVPLSVVFSTIKAVSLFAAGPAAAGVISARVAALAEGVVKAMVLAKLKTTLAVIFVLGAVTLACGALAGGQLNAGRGDGLVRTPEQPVKGAQAEQGTPAPKAAAAGKDEPRTLKLAETVQSTRWSPDGKYMVSLSTHEKADNGKKTSLDTFRIWDGQTGKLRLSLGEREDVRVQMFAFSPDSKTLAIGVRKFVPATGDVDFLELRDAATGALRRTIEMECRRTGLRFAFSKDSRTIAVCGGEINRNGDTVALVRVFDAQTGKRTEQLTWAGAFVIAVAFSPDGQWLAAGDYKGAITIWDLKNTKIHKTLAGAPAQQLLFSPDGQQLARWDQSSDVTIVDWATGKARTLQNSAAGLGTQQLAYSLDGLFIAGQSWVVKDGQQKNGIRVWDATTGDLLNEQLVSAYGLAFMPDSKRLVFLQDDKTVMLWDIVRPPLEKWIEALQSPDRDTQLRAAEAIGRFGPAGKPAVSALQSAFTDKGARDSEVLFAVGVALWKVDRAAYTALLTDKKQSRGRWAATLTLLRIGTEAKELVPVVLKMAADVRDENRPHALWVLPDIGADPDDALPVLEKAIQSKDKGNYAQMLAAQALGHYGAKAKKALPTLHQALDHPDPQVRVHAAGAVWRVEQKSDKALPVLVAALKGKGEDKGDSLNQAFFYLRAMGPEAKAAFPALLALWNDKTRTDWFEIAEALKAIDPRAAAAAGVK